MEETGVRGEERMGEGQVGEEEEAGEGEGEEEEEEEGEEEEEAAVVGAAQIRRRHNSRWRKVVSGVQYYMATAARSNAISTSK